MKNIINAVGSKVLEFKDTVMNQFSIEDLRGNESLCVLEQLVKNMNAHYGLDVGIVKTMDTPHGGYVSNEMLERNKEFFPSVFGRLKEGDTLEDYYGATGIILVNPEFMSLEVVAHEYGHAVYQSKFGLRQVLGDTLSFQVDAVIEASSTVLSLVTFATKANRVVGMAVGFAAYVPTLAEEAYASKIAIDYLDNVLEYKANRVGLKRAFGTYVLQSLVSTMGGDLHSRAGKLYIAFKG